MSYHLVKVHRLRCDADDCPAYIDHGRGKRPLRAWARFHGWFVMGEQARCPEHRVDLEVAVATMGLDDDWGDDG